MQNKVYIMTKTPFMGIIKKRLSKEVGFTKSKRLTIDNLENLKKISLNMGKIFSFLWYITPAKKFRSFNFSFSKNCLPQLGNNLGERIWNLVLTQNHPFIVIGSDIPGINRKIILKSFKILKSVDVVLGPTYDGGFWLIGFSKKKNIFNPFYKVRWSTIHTLNDLLINLKNSNTSYKFTTRLRDIDNKDDYCKNKKLVID